jgi:CheY-like chemotaxis protein
VLKIAICEDESVFAKALESIINSKLVKLDLNYSIYLFNSGEELLDKIINDKEKYDVIFFDVQLPGIDGTETARKIS